MVGDGEEETTRCHAFVRPCSYFRSRKEREVGAACLARMGLGLCSALCWRAARTVLRSQQI